MTDMSREEILALAKFHELDGEWCGIDGAKTIARALLLLAGEMGEPVAWRMTCIDPKLAKQPSPWVLLSSEPSPHNKSQYVVEPLYVSPSARPYADGWRDCREAAATGAPKSHQNNPDSFPVNMEGEVMSDTKFDAAAIDRAAKYLRETMQSGKMLTPWETTIKATKKKWLVLAEGALKAAADPTP